MIRRESGRGDDMGEGGVRKSFILDRSHSLSSREICRSGESGGWFLWKVSLDCEKEKGGACAGRSGPARASWEMSSLSFPAHVQLLLIGGSHHHLGQAATRHAHWLHMVVLGSTDSKQTGPVFFVNWIVCDPCGSRVWGLAAGYGNAWCRYCFPDRWVICIFS
ncbi:uncharacterized protein LOC121064915 isoform X1 [Cygnus olor]|uniref:uncharacterized protein LOC121064915 isoform X1 n=1 Tax=Cygnus olor TaxID=8869 RepID=UPI001ADE4276|nr:uncharacterized protein LOC121064915 isoform X1 [Cygnus olor]